MYMKICVDFSLERYIIDYMGTCIYKHYYYYYYYQKVNVDTRLRSKHESKAYGPQDSLRTLKE